jgi:hypothetical protein
VALAAPRSKRRFVFSESLNATGAYFGGNVAIRESRRAVIAGRKRDEGKR